MSQSAARALGPPERHGAIQNLMALCRRRCTARQHGPTHLDLEPPPSCFEGSNDARCLLAMDDAMTVALSRSPAHVAATRRAADVHCIRRIHNSAHHSDRPLTCSWRPRTPALRATRNQSRCAFGTQLCMSGAKASSQHFSACMRDLGPAIRSGRNRF